jgi:hypothetical protein
MIYDTTVKENTSRVIIDGAQKSWMTELIVRRALPTDAHMYRKYVVIKMVLKIKIITMHGGTVTMMLKAAPIPISGIER